MSSSREGRNEMKKTEEEEEKKRDVPDGSRRVVGRGAGIQGNGLFLIIQTPPTCTHI